MWTVLIWIPIVLLSQDPARLVVLAGGNQWANWARWDNCDKTCGGGTTFRVRSCKSPSGGQGSGCTGDEIEFGECGTGSCSGGGGQSSAGGQPAGQGGYNAAPAPPAGQGGYNAAPAPPAGQGGYNAAPAPPAGQGGYNAAPGPPAGPSGYNAAPGPPAGPSGYNAAPGPPAGPSGHNAAPGPPAGPSGYNAAPGPPAGPGGYGPNPQPVQDDAMIDTLAQSPPGGANTGSRQQNPMLIKDEVIKGDRFNTLDTKFDKEFPLGDAESGSASFDTHVIPIVCILIDLCLQNFCS